VLHLDLTIAQEEFPATNVPGSGGLCFAETQTALTEFVKHKNLLGWTRRTIQSGKGCGWQRRKKDGSDLLAEVLSARLSASSPPAPTTTEETPSTTA
jgi:hypothetical protein